MKDRRTLLYLLILSTFLISMMALLAYADTDLSPSARSSALYNPDTRSFLYQNNANQRLPMASTTKIVTALIAIETLDPNEVITIPREAVGIEGSSLYLRENDKVSVIDLIYAVLLQSANDAAAALALRISGNTSCFAEMMTERVNRIGALDTMFQNPHGLDEKDHYTTAHDLAIISAEALNNETFRKIAATYRYSFKIGEDTRTLTNHNKLIKTYTGCIGVKTGYTKKSGRCLVSAAERSGVTLVAVTLDAPDDWSDHKNMLDYGFDELVAIDIDGLIDIPADIPTVSEDGARLSIRLDTQKLVKHKNEKISYKIDLPQYIANDTKCGDKIGELQIQINDRVTTVDIVASCDVKIKKISKRFF